jgi:hypothetical protein
MARHTVFFLAAATAALLGCKSSGKPATGSAVSAGLTRDLDFPRARLISDPLPDTTDPRATLMAIGPTPVVGPGEGSIMALELDDPDERDASATLIQFEGEGSHVRVPDDKSQGGVIENDFVSAKTLCQGRCNAIFSIRVEEKVELSDGKITAGTTREIVIDCRKQGDMKACPGKGQDAGTSGGVLSLCGDVTAGQIALSGDHALDAYLDAVRQLSKITTGIDEQLKTALSNLAKKLGLAADSSAADIEGALAARIAQDTQAGLSVRLGQQGCGLRREQTALALHVCDPGGGATLDAIDCSGACEPGPQTGACVSAPSGGCRGLLETGACSGTCTGACEVALSEPAACDGTCVGSCDGPCPDDGSGGCAGPCTGMCTGKCRTLSSNGCAGSCTGLCDLAQSGEPSCIPPLRAYCRSAMDAKLGCPGDCFGKASLSQGAAACQPSALAIAQSFPRCEAPLVQLSFAFKPEVAAGEQTAFAKLVHDLNPPLVELYAVLNRLALLGDESAALATAVDGVIKDDLATKLAASPEDSGLGCANRRIPETKTWLMSEKQKLSDVQGSAMSVLSALASM